jgi:phosphopantothenoylcysteine decarboxylase/phosphopantothenate--cysteine ligase
MKSLSNKRILLGITGGIAAYKSAELARLFSKAGADVRVVMTPAATEFITPLTLQALSGNKVHTQLLDAEAEAGMGHIELARWPDLVVVAPASADFLARVASGQAGDLLSTLVLATKAPVAVAPAMNQAMWNNPATQDNLAALRARGMLIFGPDSGPQACGDVGLGRMLEPLQIIELAASLFDVSLLSGLRICITAGPTREALDPVRYISNHSSGKMGYALAAEAAAAGGLVTLISGPVALQTPERVQRVDVVSARGHARSQPCGCQPNVTSFIGVAAVADYRPATVGVTQDQEINRRLEHRTRPQSRHHQHHRGAREAPVHGGFRSRDPAHRVVRPGTSCNARKLDLLFAKRCRDLPSAVTRSPPSHCGPQGRSALGTPANKQLIARQIAGP